MTKPGIFSIFSWLSRHPLLHRVILVWFTFFYLANAGLNAGEMTDARINIGLKLFRAILAADLNIKQKTNTDNQLSLLLIYKDKASKGQFFAKNLLRLGIKQGQAKIKNIPIKVSYISYQTFLVNQHPIPAGIFIVDQMTIEELSSISEYGINNQIITFSPFDRDVEKNVTAGLAIGARVRPIINMQMLKQSDIRIKSFFLKVAKKYEP